MLVVPIQSDDQRVPAGRPDAGCRRGERLAGQLDHLQRPHDPAAVGGQDRRRRGRVAAGQLGVQRGHPDLGELLFPAGPHLGVGGREGPFVEQRLDVEHRAADDDRQRTAGRDGLDVGGGGLLVARDGRGLGDVEHVELVVRDAAALGDGELGGADVHAAVQLHGVGVHDLAAEAFGDVERQLRLAGAGRPDDRDRPRGHGAQTPTKYPTPYGAPRTSSLAARGPGSVSPASTW